LQSQKGGSVFPAYFGQNLQVHAGDNFATNIFQIIDRVLTCA